MTFLRTWIGLGLCAACGCASRRAPERYPADSPVSRQVAAAPPADVTRALASDPPLPGQEARGWPGLAPQAGEVEARARAGEANDDARTGAGEANDDARGGAGEANDNARGGAGEPNAGDAGAGDAAGGHAPSGHSQHGHDHHGGHHQHGAH